MQPEENATKAVATVAAAVRREVASMADGVENAFHRVGELEAVVHNEVNAIERAFGSNEDRIRSLLDGMEGQRQAIEEAGQALGTFVVPVVSELHNEITRMSEIVGTATEAWAVSRVSLKTAPTVCITRLSS
jgi:phage-related protein